MFKISDFSHLNLQIPFYFITDFEFYSTAASEDASNQMLLFYLTDEKYLRSLKKHAYNIAGIICSDKIAKVLGPDFNVVITDYPDALFWHIQNNMKYESDFDTYMEEGCYISNKAVIADKNVRLGKNIIIEDNAVIKENVQIGDNTVIRSGAVIGGDGFQIFRDKVSDKAMVIKHFGNVVIGNNVDIKYNTCVDKALYRHRSTIIEDNCKIDNLVHVAHGVHLKKGVFVAAGATFAGYTTIGENTFVGVNSCTRQFVSIGNNCLVGMGGAVMRNVEDNSTVSTIPAKNITI